MNMIDHNGTDAVVSVYEGHEGEEIQLSEERSQCVIHVIKLPCKYAQNASRWRRMFV